MHIQYAAKVADIYMLQYSHFASYHLTFIKVFFFYLHFCWDLILNRYGDLFKTTANKGFKCKLSTEMCIFILKVIECYKMYNSPIYLCYLAARKAFDKINHCHLFSKLIDRNLPTIIVCILLTLDSCQK